MSPLNLLLTHPLSFQQLPSEAGVLPSLPIPLLQSSSISVLLGPLPPPAEQYGTEIFASRINFGNETPDEARQVTNI